MRCIALILFLCFASTVQAAPNAQNAGSIYGGVFGGFTTLPDLDISAGAAGDFSLETDGGYGFGAVVGYKWWVGLRAELEISYRENDLDNASGFILNGDISALTVMGNVWYDFQTGTPWIPYVGGGLGVARIDMDSSAFPIDDSDVVLAGQIGGGIGFELSPGIVVSADYRFLATSDAELADDFGAPFDQEYMSHSVFFGIRGHF